jgi:hexosaminidase
MISTAQAFIVSEMPRRDFQSRATTFRLRAASLRYAQRERTGEGDVPCSSDRLVFAMFRSLRMTSRWFALLFLALVSQPDRAAAPAADSPLPLIPAPATVAQSPGYFTLPRGAALIVRGNDAQALGVARYFAKLADASYGLHLDLQPHGGKPGGGAIEFVLDRDFLVADDPGGEGYELSSSENGVRLVARTPHGLFNGAITLWQLLSAAGDTKPLHVPRVAIADHPRFVWRGLMLDSARHLQSVPEIERLLDQMAQHKLDVLHWHLTDDQGWRIEIRKYPKLTQIGAWRTPAAVQGKPARYGGFYTQAQIRHVVAYAAERFITVVPEIEMPGHAQAAIAAYPEFGVTGSAPPVSPDWGVHTYLYNVDEKTFAFIEDVLTEVMELFPSSYIHVGGDEAAKDQWKSSAAVQQRMRELGIKDEAALQGYFTARIEKFLAAHGRKLIGWDEILEGGVPARATVMSWRGNAGGIAAAKGGHDVVMSPSPPMYFDHVQSALHDEPPGRPDAVTLADVYAFDAVPPELAGEQAQHVLGAQANLWTEYMDTDARLEHATFPRAAALAETLWSPPARRDWRDFLARMPAQIERYRAAHVAFADSAFAAAFNARAASEGAKVEISNQARFGDLRYASSSGPDAAGAMYSAPLELHAGETLRATAFSGTHALAQARAFGTADVRRRNSDELVSCVPGGGLALRLPGPSGDGAAGVYRVNIFDPCWIYPAVDLGATHRALLTIGALPYNFQLWTDAKNVVTRNPTGHLQIRVDNCQSEPVVDVLVTKVLGGRETASIPVELPQQSGAHDLCIILTRAASDPLWALDRIELPP